MSEHRELADPMHDAGLPATFTYDPTPAHLEDPLREFREALERGEDVPVYDQTGRRIGHAVGSSLTRRDEDWGRFSIGLVVQEGTPIVTSRVVDARWGEG